jgi:hypothetical protein
MEKLNSLHLSFEENSRLIYYGEAGGDGAVIESADYGSDGDTDYDEGLCACPEVDDLVRQIEDHEERIQQLEDQTIGDLLERSADGAVDWAQDQYEDARDTIAEFTGGVIDGANEFVDEQTEALVAEFQEVKQELARLKLEYQQKARDVAVLVNDGFQDILESGIATVEELQDLGSAGIDLLMEAAEKAQEFGTGIPKKLQEAIIQKGQEIATWSGEQVVHYLGLLKDIGENAQEALDTFAEECTDWTQETVQAVLDKCQELGLEAERFAIKTIQAMQEEGLKIAGPFLPMFGPEFYIALAKEAKQWSAEQLSNGLEQVRGLGRKAEAFVEVAIDRVDEIVDSGMDKALGLYEAAVDLGQDAQKVAEGIVKDVENWGEGVALQVSEFIEEKGEEAKVLVETLVQKGAEIAKLALIVPVLPFIVLAGAVALGIEVKDYMGELAGQAQEWGEEQWSAAIDSIQELGDDAKVFVENLIEQGAELVSIAGAQAIALYEEAVDMGLGAKDATERFIVAQVDRIETWGEETIAAAIDLVQEKGAEVKVLAQALAAKGEQLMDAGVDKALAFIDTAIGIGVEVGEMAEAVVKDIDSWSDAQIQRLAEIIESGKGKVREIAQAVEQKAEQVVAASKEGALLMIGALVAAGIEAERMIVALVDSIDTWGEETYEAVAVFIKEKTAQGKALAKALETKAEDLAKAGIDKALWAIDTAIGAGLEAQAYVDALIESGKEWTGEQVEQAVAILNEYGDKAKVLAQALEQTAEQIVKTVGDGALLVIAAVYLAGVEGKKLVVAFVDTVETWGEETYDAVATIVKEKTAQGKALALALGEKAGDLANAGVDKALWAIDTAIGAGVEAQAYVDALIESGKEWTGEQVDKALVMIDAYGDKAKALAQHLVEQTELLVRLGGAKAAEVIAKAEAAGARVKKATIALANAGYDFTAEFLVAAKHHVIDVPVRYLVAVAKDVKNWTGEQAEAMAQYIEDQGNKLKAGYRGLYRAAVQRQRELQAKGEDWRHDNDIYLGSEDEDRLQGEFN